MDTGTIVLTGVTIGGMLAIPAVTEVFKENAILLVAGILSLSLIYLLSPYSPECQWVWTGIVSAPGQFISLVQQNDDCITRMLTEFRSALS